MPHIRIHRRVPQAAAMPSEPDDDEADSDAPHGSLDCANSLCHASGPHALGPGPAKNALASPDGLNHDRPMMDDSHASGLQTGMVNGADPTLRDPNAALKSYDHRMTIETTLGVLFVVAVTTTAIVLWISLDKNFRRCLLRVVTLGRKGQKKPETIVQGRSTFRSAGGPGSIRELGTGPTRPAPPMRTNSGDSGTTIGSRLALAPVLSTVSEELTRVNSRPPVLPPIVRGGSTSSDGTLCISPTPTDKSSISEECAGPILQS